jgi:KipI family sensor histidine kinase inhibitor
MLRVKEAGDSALLLELDHRIDPAVNARAIAIAAAVNGAGLAGVRDVVPTFRSVAVYVDPLVADVARLRALLQEAESLPPAAVSGRTIEVPVAYGGDAGPDLEDVAAYAGVSSEQVIARHTSVDYRVYMLGFLPGFAYMGLVPPEIAMPRRPTPRLRVAAGSVGIAGPQTAVYPRASPGGWQIIGRTSMPVFDAARTPAALFAPGDTVRFVEGPAEAGLYDRELRASGTGVESGFSRTITVLQPGLYTTVQDSGRWGHQSSGVPVSGALDGLSHRLANALVGNDRGAATLEVTLAGPELRFDAAATIAITGARLSPTHDGASVAMDTPVPLRRGAVLRFGERAEGARAYIAIDGGIGVPPVLGSRATHALTALGGFNGRPLALGDTLPLAPALRAPARRRVGIDRSPARGGVRVRVLPGPQDDFFPEHAFESLQRSRFHVAPQSDRMGYRLVGSRLPRLDDREMISDATFPGGIQVPASGEPILLMADRQTTGGYPQIATVITADLPLAGQLAPGDWIEFQICSRAEAVAALVGQEGKLLAIG